MSQHKRDYIVCLLCEYDKTSSMWLQLATDSTWTNQAGSIQVITFKLIKIIATTPENKVYFFELWNILLHVDHGFLLSSQVIESLKHFGLGLFQSLNHAFVIQDVLLSIDDTKNLWKKWSI